MTCSSMPAPRSLRLLIVTNYFPAHGGGIERVAERLAEELGRRQVKIEWLASNTDAPPQPTRDRAVTPVATCNLIERRTQLPYPIWWPSAGPLLWRAIRNADVVHVHEHLYFGSILAVCMARLSGRPVVITQHMGALGLRGRLATAAYHAAARALGAVVFGLATRVVFISANVRDFFHRSGCRKSRLIFNGIDGNRFTAGSREQRLRAREMLGIDADRRVILFVGRFVRKKGLEILAALAGRFPELTWVFAGSGPQDPSSWNLDNVRVLGRLGHERLAGVYQAADLLMLPSSGEGFPLVVQEALACGLGVLSTEEVRDACPPASELIRAHRTPRLSADIDGWERALRAVLADTAYLGAVGERAARAHQLWSWEGCAAQYLTLFRELAGAGHLPERNRLRSTP